MNVISWEEIWRISKLLKANQIKPPGCTNVYWAGPSRTQEERDRGSLIAVAFRSLRAQCEAYEETRQLVDIIDPCFKTASIFVKNKVWIKLHPRSSKVFIMREKVHPSVLAKIETFALEMEAAMLDKQR